MVSEPYLISRNIHIKNLIKTSLLFLVLFAVFFLYQKRVVSDNYIIIYIVNTLVLIIFILSIFKIKFSLYLFIFFIPLLNSLTTILAIRSVPIILLLFFSLCLGFIVNNTKNNFDRGWYKIKSKIAFDLGIAKPVLVFIIIFAISSLITIFRYSNFYPFITNRYYDLIVNINGIKSTGSIFWTIRFFFNYIIGFALLFIVFNVLDEIKDIIKAIIVLISSSVISSVVGLYQYFYNPFFGSIEFWVKMNRLNATFTDPNSLGAYTLLLLPIFISLIIFFKKWYVKLITGILFIPFLMNMFFSGSRSAFLGMSVSLFIFIVIGVWIGVRKVKARIKIYSRLKKVFIATPILLVCIFLVFLGFNFFSELLNNVTFENVLLGRVNSTFNAAIGAFKNKGLSGVFQAISPGRYLLWSQAVEMFKDYPISGVGLGAYIIELPNYYVKSGVNSNLVDYTGNYYLQILSELGIAGLVAVLFIFYLIIKKVFIYFKRQKYVDRLNDHDWLPVGFFISFVSMIAAQFFGPHTNFTEIQFTFWLIIGLMLTYIKVKENSESISIEKDYSKILNNEIREDNILKNKSGSGKENQGQLINKVKTASKKIKALNIGSKVKFDLVQKISLVVIILIFTVSFFVSSFSNLSINVKQNLYGWENKYGFYEEEISEDKKFRWTNVDASESIEKKGSSMVIPLRAGNPDIYKRAVFARIYVDNFLVKVIRLKDDNWHDIELNLPNIKREEITLTTAISRSWVPKEWGVSNDTRELGIAVGEIKFIR